MASVTTRDLATVSVTQTVLDANAPVQGAITMTGDQSARLYIINWASRSGGALQFTLLSTDDTSSPVQHYVTITDGRTSEEAPYQSLQVTAYAPGTVAYYAVSRGDTGLFERSGWSFRINDVVLDRSDGTGNQVRLDGAVTLGTRTLTADTPSTLAEYASEADEYTRVTYVMQADGVFRIRVTEGNRTTERRGLWERDADGRLSLTVPYSDGSSSETLSYNASLEGGALVLSTDDEFGSCSALCRQNVEEVWGMEPGSLRAHRTESVFRFAPALEGASASARAAAQPSSPLPAAVRDRLLVQPTAR